MFIYFFVTLNVLCDKDPGKIARSYNVLLCLSYSLQTSAQNHAIRTTVLILNGIASTKLYFFFFTSSQFNTHHLMGCYQVLQEMFNFVFPEPCLVQPITYVQETLIVLPTFVKEAQRSFLEHWKIK